jgi:hypothetical protein
MARFLSQVYTLIRGSVGGVTYTANQFQSLIAKARVSPVNPATVNQGIIRSALAQASGAWKQLTQSGRDAWDAYADTCEFTGPMGTYKIPGRQMFVAVISLAQYINARELYSLTVTPTAPAIPGFFSPGPFSIVPPSSIGTGIGLSISNTTGTDGIVLIERSIAFNATRERYKGPFLSDTAQVVAIPSGASTTVEFLDLAEDYVYFTRCRLLTDEAPFRMSASYIFRHIAEVVSV